MNSTRARKTIRVRDGKPLNIALIAHDNLKNTMVAWAADHRKLLGKQKLFATGTTGALLQKNLGLKVHRYRSGPLGGDLQIGAKIVEGKIDLVIFFWDPLEPQPHDPDVKALLRLAVVWNIPIACNRASADHMISSPLMGTDYSPMQPDFDAHNERFDNQPVDKDTATC